MVDIDGLCETLGWQYERGIALDGVSYWPERTMSMVQVKQANLASASQADRIAEAVAGVVPDLTPYSAWNDLDALSSHTEVEAVEPLEGQIFLEGHTFAGNCVVYVQLTYGDGDDGANVSDSYPGKFWGHIDGGSVVIDDIEVDTSSFYE